jgi:uncharacterized damage-inducible protein DinB
MADVDDWGRTEPPLDGDEVTTLVGFLEYQRATLAYKCAGLDSVGFNTTIAASSMTLGGILKHLSYVEEWWFSLRLFDNHAQRPWSEIDWSSEPDWDWHSASQDTPEEIRILWQESIERSRELLTLAMANGGLDQFAQQRWPDGRSPNLRWILCHMIEEYARHNGHVDLLRESLDGLTGE